MDIEEMYRSPLLPDLAPKTEAELRAEMDRMERLAYIQDWKQVLDEANREETIRRLAEEEGIAKGKAEGIAEGKAEGARETSVSVARNLLSLGIPVDKIAQATQLSIQEIESLNEQG